MRFRPIALLMLIVGIILVIIPDTGPVLIRFNQDHGPSLTDVIGLALILLVWMALVCTAWRKRKQIVLRLGRDRVNILLTLILLCSFLIPLGLKLESDLLLFGSAIVNLVCQVIIFKKLLI